ncbi:hypothetical protein QAD02_006781 [Eretmocerus hayati]|uniref:Uncharacterized protein n=1 Tax=Eretmocerus hayati TaxID=131215 RepID=A0ACC2N479_9HYME|nr:hypothetical protein QAD02_006781 [Eretmocerus hayati]
MKSILLLCSISCLVANISFAKDCKPLSKHVRTVLALEDIITVPKDYCYISNVGLYKLHKDLKTWNNARETCNDEGARLAIINSEEEANELTKMFQQSGLLELGGRPSDGVLIGFHDLYNEGQFVTILGEPLEEAGYNKWSKLWPGVPDNIDNNQTQNCGALARDGGLDDVLCTVKLGFICEIPMCKIFSEPCL